MHGFISQGTNNRFYSVKRLSFSNKFQSNFVKIIDNLDKVYSKTHILQVTSDRIRVIYILNIILIFFSNLPSNICKGSFDNILNIIKHVIEIIFIFRDLECQIRECPQTVSSSNFLYLNVDEKFTHKIK